MLDENNGNVAMFCEQQHEPTNELPERVFESYIRIREKWRQRTTCIVIYTGSSLNVNTYAESCFGCEVSIKYRTYYLPEKSAAELRADRHPFALVMLAGRLALDAGDDVKLREKYAEEIAEIMEERGYDEREKFFIINFAEKIFGVREPEISDHVKEVYKMQLLPLEEYAEKVRLEHAVIDGIEKVARKMLARGMPLLEVAEITELPVEDLQELVPH
jgi:DNA-binding transcriptional ArsR family regulator